MCHNSNFIQNVELSFKYFFQIVLTSKCHNTFVYNEIHRKYSEANLTLVNDKQTS